MKSNRIYLLALLSIFVAFIPAILLRDFNPLNELNYLGIATESMQRGSFFALYQDGSPYSDKPPLYLWICMLAVSIAGQHAMPLVLLASVIPFIYVISILDRYLAVDFRHQERLLIMLGMCSLLSVDIMAVIARMDMLFTAVMLLAYMKLVRRYTLIKEQVPKAARPKYGNLSIPLLLFLGIFIKGPYGLLFPLLSLVVLMAFNRDLRRFFVVFRPYYFIIMLLLTGLWVMLVYMDGGREYVYNLFIGQSVRRVTSFPVHVEPFYFYLKNFLVLTLPVGLCFVFFMLRQAIKREAIDLSTQACLFFTLTVLAVISIPVSKLEIYLLPAIPTAYYYVMLSYRQMQLNARLRYEIEARMQAEQTAIAEVRAANTARAMALTALRTSVVEGAAQAEVTGQSVPTGSAAPAGAATKAAATSGSAAAAAAAAAPAGGAVAAAGETALYKSRSTADSAAASESAAAQTADHDKDSTPSADALVSLRYSNGKLVASNEGPDTLDDRKKPDWKKVADAREAERKVAFLSGKFDEVEDSEDRPAGGALSLASRLSAVLASDHYAAEVERYGQKSRVLNEQELKTEDSSDDSSTEDVKADAADARTDAADASTDAADARTDAANAAAAAAADSAADSVEAAEAADESRVKDEQHSSESPDSADAKAADADESADAEAEPAKDKADSAAPNADDEKNESAADAEAAGSADKQDESKYDSESEDKAEAAGYDQAESDAGAAEVSEAEADTEADAQDKDNGAEGAAVPDSADAAQTSDDADAARAQSAADRSDAAAAADVNAAAAAAHADADKADADSVKSNAAEPDSDKAETDPAESGLADKADEASAEDEQARIRAEQDAAFESAAAAAVEAAMAAQNQERRGSATWHDSGVSEPEVTVLSPDNGRLSQSAVASLPGASQVPGVSSGTENAFEIRGPARRITAANEPEPEFKILQPGRSLESSSAVADEGILDEARLRKRVDAIMAEKLERRPRNSGHRGVEIIGSGYFLAGISTVSERIRLPLLLTLSMIVPAVAYMGLFAAYFVMYDKVPQLQHPLIGVAFGGLCFASLICLFFLLSRLFIFAVAALGAGTLGFIFCTGMAMPHLNPFLGVGDFASIVIRAIDNGGSSRVCAFRWKPGLDMHFYDSRIVVTQNEEDLEKCLADGDSIMLSRKGIKAHPELAEQMRARGAWMVGDTLILPAAPAEHTLNLNGTISDIDPLPKSLEIESEATEENAPAQENNAPEQLVIRQDQQG